MSLDPTPSTAITPAYVRAMALYGAWQNRSLLAAADGLDEAARRLNRGAFFGSIHATLSHLLWGDRAWLARFTDGERPPGGIAESTTLFPDWEGLKRERGVTDASILAWAETLDPAWLEGDLSWFSGAFGRELTRPRWQLVAHMFNHATHHRGQVHAMLTAAGATPDATDLMRLDLEAPPPHGR